MGSELTDSKILDEIAMRIADGFPVDWEEELRKHEHLRGPLEQLRIVSEYRDAHQSPVPVDATNGGADSLVTAQPATPVLPTTDPAVSHTDLPPMPEPPWTWGRLEAKELIGSGGFGYVYRAHDPVLKRDVALKIRKPQRGKNGNDIDRFIREAQLHAKVEHENVLRIHGASRNEQYAGLWTDLIEGETLEAEIRRGVRRNDKHAATIGVDLCRALAAVHKKKLVHRDVKTGNIMISKSEGKVILMDFSSAAEVSTWKELFSQDPVAGTPLFAGPEVLCGQEAGVAADIYSLGVVLYRMVTGAFPVQGRTISELRDKHAEKQAIPLLELRPDLDGAFVLIVERALAHDPKDRYQSVGEMHRDLWTYLRGPQSQENPVKPFKVAAFAALAVLVALLTWWIINFIPDTQPIQVSADLMRSQAGRDDIVPSRASAYAGEKFYFQLTGSRDVYVYALNINSQGGLISLYPSRESEMGVPLAREMLHRIPSVLQGTITYWELGGRPGTETFLLIASASRLDQAEELLSLGRTVQEEPAAAAEEEQDDPPVGTPEKASRDRGIWKISRDEDGNPEPRDERARELWNEILSLADERPDIWTRKFGIENRGK